MVTIYVFHEFAELEALERLVNPVIVNRASPLLSEVSTPELSELYTRNIKIFFNGNKDAAYHIKAVLERNSFATFVTDQLTLKLPNGRISQLPKDRIIMSLK